MKGIRIFLKQFAGRGLFLGMLVIILLQLTGANAAAMAQSCGQWSVVKSPSVGNGENSLYGITAISPNNVWAVGTTGSATLTEHWNGTQWSVVKSPSIGNFYPILFSVTAVSTNDVWAVGYSGEYPNYTTIIEQWNGHKWSLVKSPNSAAQLTGVSAVSANDIWAVGDIGTYAPIIEHWNGTQWSIVPNPNSSTFLSAVTAISTNDVWAVGYTLNHDPREALIEHWDGTSWSQVGNPPPPNACLPAFGGVTAISSNDVWAVGSEWGNCYDSPPYTLTEHWNGTQWKAVHSPEGKGNLTGQLNGVAAAATNNVWAVGNFYDLQQAATYHWNGTHWSNVANPTLPYSYLYGVAATPAGDFWAVGTYIPPNSAQRTLIEFYC
ncbi:MAG TPA: hypothetical protein VFA09_05035 [Ktedonobacteraceae bacterium]|jgi:hypothetical protein|nr:hypothetical protein [Ktedonobacteraceae bacterium]